MTELSPDLETEARQVMDALRPRRRARPRLAEPLREARDAEVATPFGPVMAWRLDPWGASAAAPATLLVHGWEDDNALWGPMIEALTYAGRPVVALDLPGHGFSAAEECSIGRAAASIAAVAEAMGPVDSLIAHSFGCPASTRAMADGLKIDRAVLMSSPDPTARVSGRWERIRDRMGISEAVLERVVQLSAEKEAQFPPFDYEALAGGMTGRALFIHSIDDEDCPPETSRRLADAWPGAGLQWVDGLGHRLLVQDEATIAAVVQFVEGG